MRRDRKEVIIGAGITAAVNLGVCFVPGAILFVWLLQWAYLVPGIVVLLILKRFHIVAAVLLVGGTTFVLDIAYCGYAVSHGLQGGVL